MLEEKDLGMSDDELEKLLSTLQSKTEFQKIYHYFRKVCGKSCNKMNFVGANRRVELIDAGVSIDDIVWERFDAIKVVSCL
jgi:hypothetical protein